MEPSIIPPTAYAALGALLAALVAGFFSFSNLVSAKENKVSEFRLAWINGLRDEIAIFTAAIQELARVERTRDGLGPEDQAEISNEERERNWLGETEEPYRNAVESLTRIQLRLNPKHIEESPDGPEAKLMAQVRDARANFNAGDYDGAYDSCEAIRLAAAPLLKSTWDLVKNGEPGYRSIRKRALQTIVGGILIAAFAAAVLVFIAASQDTGANNSSKPTPLRGAA
jgi:hypothetical protein